MKKKRVNSDARVTRTAKNLPLEPIWEERDDTRALVPVTYETQRRARNALLKHKAKVTPGYNYKRGNDDTFVTGGGVPGRGRTAQVEKDAEESEEEQFFESLEDELLMKVDKHEKDF